MKRERGWRGGGKGGGGGRAGNLCVEAINPCKGINLTVLGKEKNVPVYHGGRVGARVGRVGQLNLCVETIHYFKGINVTVLERMHQFIM